MTAPEIAAQEPGRVVAFLLHPERSDAAELVRQLIVQLKALGHESQLNHTDAAMIGLPDLGCTDEDLAAGADLAVSVGGDGTMLRTFELAAPCKVPVLGVHVGHLGYLTEFEPDGAFAAISAALAGELVLEERMMIETHIERVDGSIEGPWCGLNEAVVEKQEQGRTVRLGVSIDGAHFANYSADGLIVATPTGSTAYNLSARGPIVAPQHRSIQVTAVAPHQLFDRTLVLGPDSVVRIEVIADRDAALSVDGRTTASLGTGDVLVTVESATSAILVTSGTRNFHQILKTKFGLKDS
ncbi:MAG: NAD+ kinase [Candidatus Poriferisodalaceae bacterium]|jgi:NAD+ kinase